MKPEIGVELGAPGLTEIAEEYIAARDAKLGNGAYCHISNHPPRHCLTVRLDKAVIVSDQPLNAHRLRCSGS